MRIIRMLFRTFGESLKNVFRHGWLSFSAILSITVTLLLTSILLIVSLNVEQMTKTVAQGLSISVYLNYEVTDAEAIALQNNIKNLPNVADVTYATEDEELRAVVESFGVGVDDLFTGRDNPLFKTLTIIMVNPEDYPRLEATLRSRYSTSIETISYNQDVADRVLPFFQGIRNVAFALIIAVAFVAIILISNTIRITIVARRTEIGIMRLVAASNWYIRTPFIIEGIFLGIIGALIATGITVGAYWYYTPLMAERIALITVALVPWEMILSEVLVWTVGIGGIIGLIGSFFPVRKYLRK
jgi:Cell division protein